MPPTSERPTALPQQNPQNFSTPSETSEYVRANRGKDSKNQAFGALSGFPERMQSQRTADTTIYKTIITGIAYVRSIIINTILASRKRYRTSFPRQPKPWNLRANMRIGETRSRRSARRPATPRPKRERAFPAATACRAKRREAIRRASEVRRIRPSAFRRC